MRYHFTYSRDNISLLFDGQMHGIPKSHPSFNSLRDHLKLPDHDYATISDMLNTEKMLSRLTNGAVRVVGNTVYYAGKPVRSTLTEKLLDMLEEGFDATPWAIFLGKLMQNPSERSRQCLFDFLEAGESPITEDGCFIAFKMVREDFTDIHSGTFDNSPGRIVSMPRDLVNDDPNQTCSAGLHVCSLAYFKSGFGGSNKRFLCVKVNPADVVAVPHDYSNSKMRCCRYEVMGEVDNYGSSAYEVAQRSFMDTGSPIAPPLNYYPPADEVEIELIDAAFDSTEFTKMWFVDHDTPARLLDYVIMSDEGFQRMEDGEALCDEGPEDGFVVGAVVGAKTVGFMHSIDAEIISGTGVQVLWQDGNYSDRLFIPDSEDYAHYCDVIRVKPRMSEIFRDALGEEVWDDWFADEEDWITDDEFEENADVQVASTPSREPDLSPYPKVSDEGIVWQTPTGEEMHGEQIILYGAIYGPNVASRMIGITPDEFELWRITSVQHLNSIKPD